jgi:hypothetical protein
MHLADVSGNAAGVATPRHQETVMECKPLSQIVYTVRRAQWGQWEINESGYDRSIASFSNKYEAVEYAQCLAEAKMSAEVLIQE